MFLDTKYLRECTNVQGTPNLSTVLNILPQNCTPCSVSVNITLAKTTPELFRLPPFKTGLTQLGQFTFWNVGAVRLACTGN